MVQCKWTFYLRPCPEETNIFTTTTKVCSFVRSLIFMEPVSKSVKLTNMCFDCKQKKQ